MANSSQILSKIFFWTFERGSWQYDLAVVGILVFVLLTPAKWFHDQPQVGAPPAPGEVSLILDANGQQTYRVDARILAPPERTPKLQNDLHGALQKAVPELNTGRFEIQNIEAIRDEQGTVTAYGVVVKRK